MTSIYVLLTQEMVSEDQADRPNFDDAPEVVAAIQREVEVFATLPLAQATAERHHALLRAVNPSLPGPYAGGFTNRWRGNDDEWLLEIACVLRSTVYLRNVRER